MKWISYIIDKWRTNRGLIKQRKSFKDYKYEKHFKIAGSFQEIVDLRPHFKDVLDQRNTQSCTGFAVGAMCEYLLETEFNKGWRKISPLYNWYYGKQLHGWEDEDQGVWLRYSLKALFDKGFVYYQTMPFTSPYVRPPTEWENALGEMVKTLYFTKERFGYYLLDSDLEMIKDALSNKNPIVFGCYINSSFYGNRDGIILDTVNNGEAHAMLIVGYDDKQQHFIVRNSWGKIWGDNGYAYIPYDYLIKNSFDLWTIRRKIN